MASKKYCGREASVYLPSGELLSRWKQEAKKYGLSVSDYIFEMTERGRRANQENEAHPDLVRENSDLKSRCLQLESELKLAKSSLQNANAELYKFRFGGFQEIDAEGASEYDREIVVILRRGGVIDTRELLSGLGIDPRNSQAVRLVSNQLEGLRRFGLVIETHNGWKWVG